MHAKGKVSYGGVLGAALVADIETDDGRKYHFAGGYGFVGSPEGGYGYLEGDFPGLDHIEGSCAFETVAGNFGPGGLQITFFDLHGTIGTLAGYTFGGGIGFGMGGGSWTDEAAAVEKDDADNPPDLSESLE